MLPLAARELHAYGCSGAIRSLRQAGPWHMGLYAREHVEHGAVSCGVPEKVEIGRVRLWDG